MLQYNVIRGEVRKRGKRKNEEEKGTYALLSC